MERLIIFHQQGYRSFKGNHVFLLAKIPTQDHFRGPSKLCSRKGIAWPGWDWEILKNARTIDVVLDDQKHCCRCADGKRDGWSKCESWRFTLSCLIQLLSLTSGNWKWMKPNTLITVISSYPSTQRSAASHPQPSSWAAIFSIGHAVRRCNLWNKVDSCCL